MQQGFPKFELNPPDGDPMSSRDLLNRQLVHEGGEDDVALTRRESQ